MLILFIMKYQNYINRIERQKEIIDLRRNEKRKMIKWFKGKNEYNLCA